MEKTIRSLSSSLSIAQTVSPLIIHLHSILLTLETDALKQLRIIEHTPKHEDQDILSGLTAEEKRDVLEFVRNRKVHSLSHLSNGP